MRSAPDCARWQASWYATVIGSGCRSATALSSSRNSVMSRALAASASARGPLRLVPHLVVVLLDVGTAPRGVHHDRVDAGAFEHLDRPLGEVQRLLLPPAAAGQRTAAPCRFGRMP